MGGRPDSSGLDFLLNYQYEVLLVKHLSYELRMNMSSKI